MKVTRTAVPAAPPRPPVAPPLQKKPPVDGFAPAARTRQAPPAVTPRERPAVNVAGANVVAALLPPKLDASFANPRVFDAKFYAEHNPDLRQAGLSTPAQLEAHWLQHGVREGRIGSASFDPHWCKAQYGRDFPDAVSTPEQTIRTWNSLAPEAQATLATSALRANLPYGSKGLAFDLYTPPAGATQGKVPVVITLVGGGYQSAQHDHPVQRETGVIFSGQGIAVLSPQYSTAPARYPAPQQDVLELLRYVKDHAAENNWDLDRVTLMGGSAGGHLALDTALNPRFAAQLADLPKVKNVISMAAPAMAMEIPNFISAAEAAGASPKTHLDDAQTLARLTEQQTRFFVTWAKDDPIIPAATVTPLVDKLEERRLAVTIREHEVGGHGDWLHPQLDPNPHFNRAWQNELAQWVLAG